jgi:hypothetical protein
VRIVAFTIAVSTALLCFGCVSFSQSGSASGQDSTRTTGQNGKEDLPEESWKKLDHALKLLLREGPENPFFDYQTRDRDGETAYGVLIRTSDPETLKESDLPFGSPSSEILTARLTIPEIKQAARLGSIVSISNPSEAQLH